MHECRNMFLTEEEIVTDMLLYRLTEVDKSKIRQLEAHEVKELFADWSQTLIDHYRLHDENNPYVVADAMHDNYSIKVAFRVVARVWARLTGNPAPEYAVSHPSGPDYWI